METFHWNQITDILQSWTLQDLVRIFLAVQKEMFNIFSSLFYVQKVSLQQPIHLNSYVLITLMKKCNSFARKS